LTNCQLTLTLPPVDGIEHETEPVRVAVAAGVLLSDAVKKAGVDLAQPCGGQGRCGRCAVIVHEGKVRSRSSLRLSASDLKLGYRLSCQSVIEGDAVVEVPPQEKLERRLVSDLKAADTEVPGDFESESWTGIKVARLAIAPPSMDDQTDDLSRLRRELRREAGIGDLAVTLGQIQTIGAILRERDWKVTATVDNNVSPARLLDLRAGIMADDEPIWAAAIDIGTTTVSVWLVDLLTGKVQAKAAEYNRQISRGEDVISRIVYGGKNEGGEELRQLVLQSINLLLERTARRCHVNPDRVVKAVIAGNSTMIHLLLGLPARSIRMAPFVTATNHIPIVRAAEVGLEIAPGAVVDCLPGVASYVGSDISAGVLASGMDDSDEVSLFIDIGTNGEIVLGSSDWLVACACSAGPAFEGSGVRDGMRATSGAIEEFICGTDFEPTITVIGGDRPKGICGSGLISMLAELFLTGVVDKAGHINMNLPTDRIRAGEYGAEYVVVWGSESKSGDDIVITQVDIENLVRAKAAIFAGFAILGDSVGVPIPSVNRVLIGGAFGKYINIEQAIQIGLLPDLPWEKFHFLGNTAVQGAYSGLISSRARQRIAEIANRMTYIELSADNSFYEAFVSALFLPHTDMGLFPTVSDQLRSMAGSREAGGNEEPTK